MFDTAGPATTIDGAHGGAVDLSVRVLTSEADLDRLAPSWDALWERTPDATIYQSRQWALAAWQHLRCRDRLHVVTISEGGRLAALAPLVRMRMGVGPAAFDYYVPLGQEQADYGGFLLGPDPSRTAPMLFEYLGRLVDRPNRVLVLPRLVIGSASHESALTLGRDHRIMVGEEQSTTCSHLDLSAYEDPIAEVQRRAKRRSVPRLARRLAEVGPVTYAYHDPSPAALEAVFDVHRRRWEARSEAMQGMFSTSRLRDFTRALVATLDAEGQVRVSSLSCGARPVAVCLGYVAKGRYYYHKPAFDPEFQRYKPGHLLIASLMESALSEGVTLFDFGRGAGQYKDSWSDGSGTAVSLVARRQHAWDPGLGQLLRRVGGSHRVRRLSRASVQSIPSAATIKRPAGAPQ